MSQLGSALMMALSAPHWAYLLETPYESDEE